MQSFYSGTISFLFSFHQLGCVQVLIVIGRLLPVRFGISIYGQCPNHLPKGKKKSAHPLVSNKQRFTDYGTIVVILLLLISRHPKPSHSLFIEPFMLSLQNQILQFTLFLHSYRWPRCCTRRLRRFQHRDSRSRLPPPTTHPGWRLVGTTPRATK